jgi:hypothetical protein
MDLFGALNSLGNIEDLLDYNERLLKAFSDHLDRMIKKQDSALEKLETTE